MEFILFVIGACIGSFYLVIGKRLPQNINAVSERSKCDNCNHTLSWWQLIPIVSYVLLLGKCYYCHKRISILNFIVELSTGALFALGYYMFGFSYNFYMFLIVASLMIIIFISDFSFFIINDSPLVVASLLALFLKYYYFGIKELGLSIISGLAMFFTMYLIKIIGDKIFKRESLGGGDIKFAFVMGLVLDYRFALCSLILSTFLAFPYSLASLAIKKNNEVPFGPFLASSLFITFLFLDKFQNLIELITLSL